MDDVSQKKKMILFGIACIGVLALVVLIVLLVLQANEAKKLKIQLGDKVFKTKTVQIQDNNTGEVYTQISYVNEDKSDTRPFMITTPNNVVYYNIKTLAEDFCGCIYNKGIYGGVPDESSDKCHIVCDGERVSFSSSSDEITKYITPQSKNVGELAYKETMKDLIEGDDVEVILLRDDPTKPQPVIQFNGQLYGTQDAVQKGFNMVMEQAGSTITVYPLESLIKLYSSVLEKENLKLTQNFKNQRALYEQLAVCEQNGFYCVVRFEEGNKVTKPISAQYDAIEYVQGIGSFITGSKQSGTLKFGMNSPVDGSSIIKAKYDYLKLIDAKNNLYLARLNDRYGVINPQMEEDKTEVIPTTYQQIGLDSVDEYANQDITNKYILDNYTIFVKRDNKFGLATKDGYLLVAPRYAGFGCKNPTEILKKAGTDVTANPTLVIPLPNNLECVVFEDRGNYGLMDVKTGSIILNAYYTAIYSAQGNGQLQYYFHKVMSGDDDQIETLDSKLKSSKELIRYIENFSGKEQSEEVLKKQSEKQNALMEESEDSSENEDEGEDQEEPDSGYEEEYHEEETSGGNDEEDEERNDYD